MPSNSRPVEWQRPSGEVRRLEWLFGEPEDDRRAAGERKRRRWWGARPERTA